LRRDEQLVLLEKLKTTDPTGPRFKPNNGVFSATDAAVYQAMNRQYKPTRVIEVGCGWSTAALFDAGAAQHVTLIEPYPDPVLHLLSNEDRARCDLLETRLHEVPLSIFQVLNSGDVLFVDSTHVAKLGSDVNRMLFEILPALSSGVIVHFHDIFHPYEYPETWVREGWGSKETYLLRAFLEYNEAFEILLWAHMLKTTGDLAIPLEDCPGSIWLQKV
jgi:Methyltransferase domain